MPRGHRDAGPAPDLHRYHECILKAVYTCLPVENVCSIDEMACRLTGTERQVPVARELALKLNAPCAIKEDKGERNASRTDAKQQRSLVAPPFPAPLGAQAS